MNEAVAPLLAFARTLYAAGNDAAARQAYLDVLRLEPTQFSALNELATLAYASGHRSAARTAYEQAVRCHPDNPLGRVNLGNLLFEDEDLDGARAQYRAALAADSELAEAHRGLARVLSALGDEASAAPHWRRGFAGQAALVSQQYRGTDAGIPLLLVVSARGGNIPTQRFLDDTVFAVTALYAEFFDAGSPLPAHAAVFNAIGDADLCPAALARAENILSRTPAPILNPPARIRTTSRAEVARRLSGAPGMIAPAVREYSRTELSNGQRLEFPLLLRAPGFHTGRHFVRVERHEELADAVAALPGDVLLAIDYLDARSADGFARKYRVMFIDGALYPLHLAISADWKVHYFTAAMGTDVAHREEERGFLENMPGVLGPRAMAALAQIAAILNLDYAGIDFGLAPDGSVLLFEANATMVINLPDANPIWDYRRAPITRALDAAKRLVRERALASAADAGRFP
jgi:tetratricopeptide (TPR) repeat protein